MEPAEEERKIRTTDIEKSCPNIPFQLSAPVPLGLPKPEIAHRSMSLIAVDGLPFVNLFNVFLNPFIFSVSKTSCGNKFHNIIRRWLENSKMLLFILDLLPDRFIACLPFFELQKKNPPETHNCSHASHDFTYLYIILRPPLTLGTSFQSWRHLLYLTTSHHGNHFQTSAQTSCLPLGFFSPSFCSIFFEITQITHWGCARQYFDHWLNYDMAGGGGAMSCCLHSYGTQWPPEPKHSATWTCRCLCRCQDNLSPTEQLLAVFYYLYNR